MANQSDVPQNLFPIIRPGLRDDNFLALRDDNILHLIGNPAVT